MKNLKKTVAAGVIGVALMAAIPGTFATWQNSDNATVGRITTGDLEVSDAALNSRGVFTIERNGQRVELGRGGIGSFTFVPGARWTAQVEARVNHTGPLTLSDFTVVSDSVNLNLDDDGFIWMQDEAGNWTRTQLQMTINNGYVHNTAVDGRVSTWARVNIDFVRAAEAGMYDNGIEGYDLGDIRVTVTQN